MKSETKSAKSDGVDPEYLFSWDDVPGKDGNRLLKHLEDNLKIDWAKNAKIKKNDDGKAITVTKGKNSLMFKLNEEENKVSLEISGGETHEYILKEEDGKLNIYDYYLSSLMKKYFSLNF